LRYDVAMSFRISRAAYDALLDQAASDPKREVCGLMLGGDIVTRVQPTRNLAANPNTTFEIDPQALFAAIRNDRAGREPLAGYYHSHPGGVAEPSERDTHQARGDSRIWAIVASAQVTAWQMDADGMFVQLSVEQID
jgi:desampylase